MEDDKTKDLKTEDTSNVSLPQTDSPTNPVVDASTISSAETLPVPTKPAGKKRRLIFIGIIVAVVALLAGVGGAAYYVYYLPNTPENVLRQALVNQFSEESLKQSSKVTGELKIKSDNGPSANVNFSLEKDNLTGVSVNVKSFGISTDIVTKDGKSVFIKIGGLKGLDTLLEQYDNSLPIGEYEGIIKELGPLLAKLNDQWYKVDSSMLGESSEGLTKSLSGDIGISEQDQEKIIDIYLDNEFIVVDEKGATTDINGKPATEYKLHIDGQKLKDFAVALKNAGIEQIKISDSDIDSLNQFIDKNNLNAHQFSLWIDTDKNIVQVSYSHKYGTTSVDLKLTISDKGGNIQIEEPKGSKNIFELLGDIEPVLQGIEQPAGLDAL